MHGSRYRHRLKIQIAASHDLISFGLRVEVPTRVSLRRKDHQRVENRAVGWTPYSKEKSVNQNEHFSARWWSSLDSDGAVTNRRFMAVTETQECMDACNSCITAANSCLEKHLGEEAMRPCLVLCLDCITLCSACVQMLGRHSQFASRVTDICADLCDRCAIECGEFDSPECKACATACQECANRCRAAKPMSGG